jgi:hypothetical protein
MNSKLGNTGVEARCDKCGLQTGEGGACGSLKSRDFILIELLVTAILAGMMLISCFKLN